MSRTSKDEVMEYLKGNQYANLATLNADDPAQPHVSTVAYVNDGLDLYFVTNHKSQKFVNVSRNRKVAGSIDRDESDWMKITGIQIEGVAEPVSEAEAAKVFGLYAEKFPVIKNFPPNPDYRFSRIRPKKIWLLDYKKGFGHRDSIEV